MSAVVTREPLPIERTHARFLLKQLSFTQQFASMYFVRLAFLKERATRCVQGPVARRVLELPLNARCTCVGTLFKQVAGLRRFLDDYQKELVRIEAGGEDEEGEEGGVAGEAPVILGDTDGEPGAAKRGDHSLPGASSATPGQRPVCVCSNRDVLILEDDSGRVELVTPQIGRLTTGLVVVVSGVLNEQGKFIADDIRPCGAAPQRPLQALPPLTLPEGRTAPRFVGFVSGFAVGPTGQASSPLDVLVDYLCGNLGDAETQQRSALISRLVVGGNSIDTTDEWRLKTKVKLEPQDHAKESASTNTIAHCMRELDHVLAQLAESIEVDVMPGDTDASNAFLPQQPVHPLMLRSAARKSTIRLVSNPYEFSVGDELCVHVTSGQNVDDLLRQVDAGPLDVMQLAIDGSCSCPTAPNTLVCYPFEDNDPFVFQQTPHVFVACNQERFETRLHTSAQGTTTRLICVPAFAATAELVLLDVTSPTLEVHTIRFN